MGDDSAAVRDKAMAAYARAEAELAAAGGYAAEAEAARIASNLGLPERVLHQPIGTLSGRSAAASRAGQDLVLRSTRPCCSTSRRTISTPTRSSGCATSWLPIPAGLLVISHDVGLLERCVNKVFHLDANRAELDMYAMGWKRYLQQRETDEKRQRDASG